MSKASSTPEVEIRAPEISNIIEPGASYDYKTDYNDISPDQLARSSEELRYHFVLTLLMRQLISFLATIH